MANRYYNQFVQTLGGNRVDLAGSIFPAGAGVPTIKGRGFTAVRTAQGIFTITFDDQFVDFESFTASLQLAALTARWVQWGTFVAASRTLVVTVHDATPTAQDVAANANNAVHFRARFKNTGSL
jgi:hypothetical protein